VLGLRRLRRPAARRRYDDGRVETPFVDSLADAELEQLNELLSWHCFTVDSHGRPFGRPAWSGKRADPQLIPDPRIERFHERFDLSGRHVLEVGCFEGVHTVALCNWAARVTAIDARVENVVKTVVRCAFFGVSPTVFTCDVERPADREELLKADFCHHVGVLYHLADPVAHLRRLGEWVGAGLMLDTHYARDEEATETYESSGGSYRFRAYRESGRADVFSGMQSQSRWLTLEDLIGVLSGAGFDAVDVAERRQERNGDRALIFASKGDAA
jgi:2-polyprenyl-3-methyl-5-hydroxy-6-metoxy-1,4-benzoquinol methylase